MRRFADGPNWSDEQTAKAADCHPNTVRNVRRRFVERGFEAAIEREKQKSPSRQRKLDGAQEARLIAESRTEPPAGRARWTLRLLADRLVELEIVESISHEAVRQTLKKRPETHLRKCWVIPPKQNAAFVARMQDILDLVDDARIKLKRLCPQFQN